MTILQFVAYMAAGQAVQQAAQKAALEKAAQIVETEAKALIGHDENPAAGQFEAWQELADSTKEEKERLGYVGHVSEYDSRLRTGADHDSIQHEVDGNEAVIGSERETMVWQEFGTDRMPPRSVLGAALVRKETEVVEIVGQAVVKTLFGKSFP